MSVFFKAIAGALLAIVLCLTLSKQNKDMALLLSVAVCCMIVAAAVTFLQPVFSFFQRLQTLGELNTDLLSVLVKATGIGLLSEITSLICEDSGNAVLGRAIKLLASGLILYIAIPMFSGLLDIIEEILVAI